MDEDENKAIKKSQYKYIPGSKVMDLVGWVVPITITLEMRKRQRNRDKTYRDEKV